MARGFFGDFSQGRLRAGSRATCQIDPNQAFGMPVGAEANLDRTSAVPAPVSSNEPIPLLILAKRWSAPNASKRASTRQGGVVFCRVSFVVIRNSRRNGSKLARPPLIFAKCRLTCLNLSRGRRFLPWCSIQGPVVVVRDLQRNGSKLVVLRHVPV